MTNIEDPEDAKLYTIDMLSNFSRVIIFDDGYTSQDEDDEGQEIYEPYEKYFGRNQKRSKNYRKQRYDNNDRDLIMAINTPCEDEDEANLSIIDEGYDYNQHKSFPHEPFGYDRPVNQGQVWSMMCGTYTLEKHNDIMSVTAKEKLLESLPDSAVATLATNSKMPSPVIDIMLRYITYPTGADYAVMPVFPQNNRLVKQHFLNKPFAFELTPDDLAELALRKIAKDDFDFKRGCWRDHMTDRTFLLNGEQIWGSSIGTEPHLIKYVPTLFYAESEYIHKTMGEIYGLANCDPSLTECVGINTIARAVMSNLEFEEYINN